MKEPAGEPRQVEVPIEVRYAETDQMGVVHHANYIVWFEMARTRLCELTGWHYADIERNGYLLMVTAAHAEYRRAVRYGEAVRVTCRLERYSSRVLRFGYQVLGPRGEHMAGGFTEHVWVRKATGRPCRIPEELRGPFEALAGSA